MDMCVGLFETDLRLTRERIGLEIPDELAFEREIVKRAGVLRQVRNYQSDAPGDGDPSPVGHLDNDRAGSRLIHVGRIATIS